MSSERHLSSTAFCSDHKHNDDVDGSSARSRVSRSGIYLNEPPRIAVGTSAPTFAIGIACGTGAAVAWAMGLVAARHGVAVGLAPTDLALHRFVWAGLALLPIVYRRGSWISMG
jgi:hypothetical protein